MDISKFVIGIVLPVLLISVFIGYAAAQYFSVDGYVKADVVNVYGVTLVIGKGCEAIVADTSPERAAAIQQILLNQTADRPTTYETEALILKRFNITMDGMQLQRKDEKYFYSDLLFRRDNEVLKIDAMPSDSIALALKMNAAIYINRTLLTEKGENICKK